MYLKSKQLHQNSCIPLGVVGGFNLFIASILVFMGFTQTSFPFRKLYCPYIASPFKAIGTFRRSSQSIL